MNSLASLQFQRPKPIGAQIADQLRDRILGGELSSGTRLPTTKELATLWQTDVKTVHNALVLLVKEGHLVRHPRIGTFVQTKKEKLTCVGVYDTAGSLNGSLFEQSMHHALREELRAIGVEMDVWVDPRPDDESSKPWAALLKAAENRAFQSLIVTGVDMPRLKWLKKLPVPTSFLSLGGEAGMVFANLSQFVDLALENLAKKGCKSVGLILPADPSFAHKNEARSFWLTLVDQFLAGARSRGLAVKNQWMRLAHANMPIQSQEQFGYDQFLQLWKQPRRPDGLVAFPDTVARGAIAAILQQQVQVPDDLKLVFHKNEAVNLLCPMPTTLLISSERELARGLIEQVRRQLRGDANDAISVPFTVRTVNN